MAAVAPLIRPISLYTRASPLLFNRSFSSSIPSYSSEQNNDGNKPGDVSSPRSGGFVNSLLHGSPKAKAEAAGHSKLVGRHKYIHQIIKHKIRPGTADQYRELIGNFYNKVHNDPDIPVRLTGSWEVVVGELDTFFHILEFDNGFAGYDAHMPRIRQTEAYMNFSKEVLPLVDKRTTFLAQEFAFWATRPPTTLGGIYEMRTYHLRPGSLLEWEIEWRRGLEARRKFVEPIGAWFSQVGRLHQVIHMWQYDDLETRKETREQAWQVDTWSQTVSKTVKLCSEMHSNILLPLPFSPLK